MLEGAPVFIVLMALSIVVQYVVDVIARPLASYYKMPSPWLAVLALAFGEALAFGVNLPLLGNTLAPWADKALMGVFLAGGSGLIHRFLKALGYVQATVKKTPTL